MTGERARASVPVAIRDLKWEDFHDLVETYYACYDERDRGDPIGITLFAERPSMEAEVDWFAHHYKMVIAGRAVSLVAEVEGRAVGLCTVTAAAATEGAHVGTLGILLRREARGQGYGEKLLRATIAQCRGRFELIELHVFGDNEGAKRLYARLGFEPAGTVPRGIKRGDRYVANEHMYLVLT